MVAVFRFHAIAWSARSVAERQRAHNTHTTPNMTDNSSSPPLSLSLSLFRQQQQLVSFTTSHLLSCHKISRPLSAVQAAQHQFPDFPATNDTKSGAHNCIRNLWRTIVFFFFRRFSDHNNNTHRIVEAPAGSSPRRRITERGWQVIAAFFSVDLDDDEEDVTTRIRRFDRSIVWWTDGDCWIWPDPTDDLCLRFLSLHCTASTMDPSLQTSQALSLRSSPVVHFLPPFPDKRNGDCLLRRLLLTFPALGFFNEMRRRRRRRGGGSWQTRQDLRVVEKTLSAFRVLLRRAVAASAAPRLRPPPRRPPPPMESNSNEEQMRSSDNADRCSCCAIRSPKQQSPRFTTRQSSQQLLKTEKAKWAPPWK